MPVIERLVNVVQCWQVQNIWLHMGVGNLNELYNMEGRPLEAVHEERDLGIMILLLLLLAHFYSRLHPDNNVPDITTLWPKVLYM